MRRFRVAAIAAAGALTILSAACDDDEAPPAVGSCTTTVPAPTGPGDAGSHLPLSEGSWWSYHVLDRSGGAAATTWRSRVRVTGTRVVEGVTATVVTIGDLDDPAGPTSEVLLAKGPSAVVRLPGVAGDALEAAIGAYEVLEFPLEPGRSFVQTHCDELDVAIDADHDGQRDRLDVHAEVTVAGEESVTVPAGTFVATRVDTRIWTAVETSSSGAFTSEAVQRDWYAPGVGVVRSVVEDAVSGCLHEESLVGYGVDGVEAGLLELRTLATGLAPANSDTETPGRPALAFDGAEHLLVTTVSTGAWAQDTLRAHRLAADGSVGAAFAPTSRHGYGFQPAAAFDGTNHLVVSPMCDSDCGNLIGQRVTPAGALLDGDAGFDIPGAGSTVYPPAVASGGDGWMVVHTEFQVEGVRASRVDANGSVLGHVVLGPPWSSVAANPAIAYGGGQYLVAWAEGAIAIRGVRIAPDGTVLDPEPIAISTFPSAKAMGGVAWDGTRFLVSWTDARRGDTQEIGYRAYDLYAARVGADACEDTRRAAQSGQVRRQVEGRAADVLRSANDVPEHLSDAKHFTVHDDP